MGPWIDSSGAFLQAKAQPVQIYDPPLGQICKEVVIGHGTLSRDPVLSQLSHHLCHLEGSLAPVWASVSSCINRRCVHR